MHSNSISSGRGDEAAFDSPLNSSTATSGSSVRPASPSRGAYMLPPSDGAFQLPHSALAAVTGTADSASAAPLASLSPTPIAPMSSRSFASPTPRNIFASPLPAAAAATAAAAHSAPKHSAWPTRSSSFFNPIPHTGDHAAEALPADQQPLLGTAASGADGLRSSDSLVKPALPSHYEQYEATVRRIRERRDQETAEKAQHSSLSPDTQRRYARRAGFCFAIVLLLVALVVYVLYPRIPDWQIQRILIQQMKLYSDGTADFAIETQVGVQNDNFLSTGVESLMVAVSHDRSVLGQLSQPLERLKLDSRATTPLTLSHDFSAQSPLNATVFGDMWSEMARSNGELTLDYDVAIVTRENFRLRNIQFHCSAVMRLDPSYVPPVNMIISKFCTHQEQTG